MKKEVKKVKRKLNYKNIFILIIIFISLILLINYVIHLPLRNIVIKGSKQIKDYEIIERLGIKEYPSFISVLLNNNKKKLMEDIRINKVDINYGYLSIEINVVDNNVLYYDQTSKKAVYTDFRTNDEEINGPLLVNYVPDNIIEDFKKAMSTVKVEILSRISEIKYSPDNVDNKRFLLTMNDGNYVYLTIIRWDNINNYLLVVREFPNKRGILYLNAGNTFEVIEEIE